MRWNGNPLLHGSSWKTDACPQSVRPNYYPIGSSVKPKPQIMGLVQHISRNGVRRWAKKHCYIGYSTALFHRVYYIPWILRMLQSMLIEANPKLAVIEWHTALVTVDSATDSFDCWVDI